MQRMTAILLARCCSLLMVFSVCFASVADDWSDKLSINGYYTLDLTTADSDVQAVSSVGELRNYDKHDLSLRNSLVGAQLEYALSDNFSLFAQGVAYYDRNNDITTDLNWAYLSYDLGNDLIARAGVFQTPFLQGTELRTVGYSRLWARPLTPGTGASGINQYYGLDLVKQVSANNYNWQFQLALGKGDHDLSEVKVDDIQLVSARIEREQSWLRAAIMRASYAVSTPRGQLIIDSGEALLASIEAEINIASLIINAGYSTSNSDVTPNDTMHYLSVAYRVDDITPFVILTKRNQYFEAFTLPAPPVGSPPPIRPPPPPPDGNADMYSVGAGLRWDLTERVAVKLQLENIRAKDDSGRRNAVGNADGSVFSFVIEGAF